MKLAGFDFGDVLVIGHAAIDDDGGVFGQPDALGQAVEHDGQGGTVLAVAGEDLMSDREPVAVDDEADDDLLAVRAMVAGIAELSFGIGGGDPLEVVRGQIVEVDRAIEVEQVALALEQGGVDGGAMRMQRVEGPVEPVRVGGTIDGQDIGESGALHPRRHGVLGGGLDEPVQGHGAGEPARARGEFARGQDVVQPEALPELVADVDRAGFAMVLGGDPLRVDSNEGTLGRTWRRSRRRGRRRGPGRQRRPIG